ncbi:hypothetical protein CASFOL_027953 [Castilleja foliolosa]|uniref:Uncharacterized protein n=1 Tax=Castilleja foliolosa TaxID=1961234 RepID=A0ABD3CJW9_9LAMI
MTMRTSSGCTPCSDHCLRRRWAFVLLNTSFISGEAPIYQA